MAELVWLPNELNLPGDQCPLVLPPEFEEMHEQTAKFHKVFFEEKSICNLGRARYKLDLAELKGYPVKEDFAAAVCALPTEYDENKYITFIDHWGTVSPVKLVILAAGCCDIPGNV